MILNILVSVFQCTINIFSCMIFHLFQSEKDGWKFIEKIIIDQILFQKEQTNIVSVIFLFFISNIFRKITIGK